MARKLEVGRLFVWFAHFPDLDAKICLNLIYSFGITQHGLCEAPCSGPTVYSCSTQIISISHSGIALRTWRGAMRDARTKTRTVKKQTKLFHYCIKNLCNGALFSYTYSIHMSMGMRSPLLIYQVAYSRPFTFFSLLQNLLSAAVAGVFFSVFHVYVCVLENKNSTTKTHQLQFKAAIANSCNDFCFFLRQSN